MNYKDLFYLGSSDNWFDLWRLFLGCFILIGGFCYTRRFLEWVIDLLFVKKEATDEYSNYEE